MDLKSKMEKFNKRWNIVSEDSYEEGFQKFKTRILNIFKGIERHVTKESIKAFCQYYGIKEVWHLTAMDTSYTTIITDRLGQEENEKEFYRLIELILSLDIITAGGYRYPVTCSKHLITLGVAEAIELSDVNVAISVNDDNDVILYPRGEKELDDELVNHVLSFLDNKSNEHFEHALKFYQANNPIKSAESLRRSLEEFLRYKLQNLKGLDANINELQKKLKADNRDPQVRNVIFQTFAYLDEYFNENSKHKDGDISNSENEFLVYQTGLLMRYVNSNI